MKNKKARNNVEELMAQSILFAIDKLSEDIQTVSDSDINKSDAETIKVLAEAYSIIKRSDDNDS